MKEEERLAFEPESIALKRTKTKEDVCPRVGWDEAIENN